jgi:drug/metabolite transporter (DMT)-like permease
MVIMFDLSYIMPLTTGIVQILSLVASSVVFKESISKQGIIGASIIIIGLIIMNYKKV